MTMQQRVHRRERQRTTQLALQARLDLTDGENSAARRFLDKGAQQFRFFLRREESMVTPAASGGIAHAHTCDETIAQLADPARRDAESLGRLLQTQPVAERQSHGLGLPELLQILRRRQNLLSFGNDLLPFE